jgi:hypothetical protein
MSSTLTDLTAATTWSGTDLFYALVGGNSRKIAASSFWTCDAANVLSDVNSTTAQTVRIYRTFTDSSNYERLALQSGSGYMELAAQTAGTGTDDLDVRLTPAGAGKVAVNVTTTDTYLDALQVRNASSGSTAQVRIHFDNSTTPTAFSSGVIFYTSTTNSYAVNSFGFWNYSSDGIIALATNNTERLRIAADGDVSIQSASILIQPGTNIGAGGLTTMGIKFGIQGIGIYAGSGVPSISATQGSLYLRTAGSSNVTRMYVNTDGSTTWTAVNTVA